MSDITKLPAKITALWLREQGACEGQVRAFKTTFPDGVTKITAAVIRKAIDAKITVSWFARHDGPSSTCLGCHGGEYPVELARLYRRMQERS